MKKIGLLFPGQGSQYVGMGKDIYNTFSEAKELFEKGNDILGVDITKIAFEGPEEMLKQTQYTQPALFMTSMALFTVLSKKLDMSKFSFMAAGHSLGEYSALCAAGFFSYEDGLKLVKARGEFIASASVKNPGTMAAVIGLENTAIRELCSKAQSESGGVCQAVNFNSPGQIVIAGSTDTVKKAVELSKGFGAIKAVLLNVSGPFHSSLMTEASDNMKAELEKYTFNKPLFNVVTNFDAQETSAPDSLSDKMVKQINNPVLWEDTMKKFIADSFDNFLEIGTGKVLTGLLKRIDRSKSCANLEDSRGFEKILVSMNS